MKTRRIILFLIISLFVLIILFSNILGKESEDSGKKSASVEYIPQNVTASDGTYDDKIAVSWTGVNGALHYYVCRADRVDAQYKRIGMTEDNFYNDCETKPEHGNYFYKIKAQLAGGALSDFSRQVSGFRIMSKK